VATGQVRFICLDEGATLAGKVVTRHS
jgi:hypothetical protein